MAINVFPAASGKGFTVTVGGFTAWALLADTALELGRALAG